MTTPDHRLRARPSDRFAGTEHLLDLTAALQSLREEARGSAKGHRQIALMHQGPVRLVLFAFSAGGTMAQHAAPGWTTIHVLRGTLNVSTAEARHELHGGMLLSLAPGVLHDVEAPTEADMLLGIFPVAQAPVSP